MTFGWTTSRWGPSGSAVTDTRLLEHGRTESGSSLRGQGPIAPRYTTNDTRSTEQAEADDRVRSEVERTGGVWGQMSPEQRAQVRAGLRDKQQQVQAARARKQVEQKTLEERMSQLEERIARLGG